MSFIFEGTGRPKLIFDSGFTHTLPEPNGSGKDELRLYDFEPFYRDKYWSESNRKVNIGKKFIFNANLRWISLNKLSLKNLWKAQEETSFIIVLNNDKDTFRYRVEVSDLDFRFFKGIPDHRAGYTVDLKLTGTELLNSPGYSAVFSQEGYGTDWGGSPENQSP